MVTSIPPPRCGSGAAAARPSPEGGKAEACPLIPEGRAVIYVAATVAIMAFSLLVDFFPILAFLALWLRHVFYRGVFTLRPSAGLILALLFPLLCCYSAFWSDDPAHTLHTGLEFLVMVLCTVIMSRLVSVRSFAKGLALGVLAVLAVTLASGHYEEDHVGASRSLVGLFGSKNQSGFMAEIGIYVSLLILFTTWKPLEKLAFGLVPLAVSAACLYLSNSVTSVISLGALLLLGAGLYAATRASPAFRAPLLAAGTVGVLVCLVFAQAADLDLTARLLEAVGKSPTLTGRTYLWAEGLKNGLVHPVLGYGYSAFWIPGRTEAERYWYEFYIPNQTGFHFHNLFIQAFVDLGGLGLALMAFLMALGCYKSLRLVLRQGMGLEPALVFGLAWLFLLRAFFEVDLLGPFGMGPLLFFAIFPRLEATFRGKAASGGGRRGLLPEQPAFAEQGAVLQQGT